MCLWMGVLRQAPRCCPASVDYYGLLYIPAAKRMSHGVNASVLHSDVKLSSVESLGQRRPIGE